MKKLGLGLAAVTVGLVLAATSARAQEQRFLFALNNPPGSNLIQQAMLPWVERFNAKAAGHIKIEPRAGFVLTNFTNYYDRVQEDVVQIGWGLQTAVGGKFSLTEVATLPWGEPSAEVLSVALWRLVKSGLVDSEYTDTVPLLLNIFPLGGIHFVTPPPAVDDYRGLKIQTSGRLQSEVMQTLGATTMALQPSEIYESLQRRTINATSTGWVAFGAFKLNEVTAYHIDNVPKATSVGQVIMSRKKYNSLSPEARKAIDEMTSEQEIRIFGAFWDRDNLFERGKTAALPNHKIYDLPDSEIPKWVARLSPVFDRWAAERPNGRALIDKFSQLLKQVKSEPRLGKQ